MDADTVIGEVLDSSMKVHSALGPGLLEHAYEAFLAADLRRKGLDVRRQIALPVLYEGDTVDLGYRMDLLIEDQIVVEVKAVAALSDLHRAQLLSYLRLSGHRFGLLLNFHVSHLKDGIVRMVNGW